MDIDHLNKMLATVEVAKYLYNLDEGKTLDKITAMAKAINDGTDDENDNEDNLNPFSKPKIQLFKNRSKISWSGKVDSRPDAPARKLASIANNVGTARNLPEDDELDWVEPSKRKIPARPLGAVVASKVVHAAKEERRTMSKDGLRTAKDAVLRSIADRKAMQEHQSLAGNSRAAEILSRKLSEGALHVEAAKLTPAQASILAKPSNAEKQPARALGDDAPAFRLPDYDTKKMMPPEFRKKIEPTQDMSFAAQKRAARRIARSKPEFSNTASLDQGSISANQLSARIPNIEPPIEDGESMAADTYKSHPNQEKQWDVSLSKPKKPVQSNNPQGSPYTGAI